jgi:pimeloyl-ACP methyl ester carboxylesterase
VPLPPPRSCPLPDGRSLAYDEVGADRGPVVVYLHGTPDSRLARHPDDGVARALGVRLLAVDRPGFGRSDPDPAGSLTALGRDLRILLDHLGIERAGLLGWSAGGLAALAAAAALGERVSRVVLAGTVPPFEAHRDPAVVADLGAARRSFVELAVEVLAEGMAPAELAEEVAAHLVPDPLDRDLARDHVLEARASSGAGSSTRCPVPSSSWWTPCSRPWRRVAPASPTTWPASSRPAWTWPRSPPRCGPSTVATTPSRRHRSAGGWPSTWAGPG